MKPMIIVAAALLAATPLHAEIYSWTDNNGTVNFTEDFSQVPKKYRKKVKKRFDEEQAAPATVSREAAPQAPVAAKKAPVSEGSAATGEFYGGKKTAQWQQEFRLREAEYKKLEQKLDELAKLIKNPVGISRERSEALPQEFKETQKEYLQALKQYNELNDVANQAGLPAEFRK